MAQGREALYSLMAGNAEWPPVVVPFGVDPWGWHGSRESYRDVCSFALENCTLLPKVYPFSAPLWIGEGDVSIVMDEDEREDGTVHRRYRLTGAGRDAGMSEVRTPGDSSWKNRSRWIESGDDVAFFCDLFESAPPPEPDVAAVREKETAVGGHGLPYIETPDPFYTVCEMFPTDDFFVRTLTDTARIARLIDLTARRALIAIERLCSTADCPFILRVIGAEMAAPPFMSRDDFIRFEGDFYREVVNITSRHNIPASFHSHGPVRDVIEDVWTMGYSFLEPFEPPPKGNLTIAEGLRISASRGVVFGGVDDVTLNSGTPGDVEAAVRTCLDDAREAGGPFILSQSSTPFHDPLPAASRENYLRFMELGSSGG